MESQSAVQEAIQRSANAGDSDTFKLLTGGLNTAAPIQRLYDDDNTSLAFLARVPGVGMAYRRVKNWQREFSPRVYGERAVLVKTSSSVNE